METKGGVGVDLSLAKYTRRKEASSIKENLRMKDTHDPIQELVKKARRNQILDAATKVFAEKGFHPTTIKDIASEAGIADGTIYNYFENKTALMLGILDRLNETERRDEDLSQATVVDIRTFMRAYFRQRFAVHLHNLEVFQVV